MVDLVACSGFTGDPEGDLRERSSASAMSSSTLSMLSSSRSSSTEPEDMAAGDDGEMLSEEPFLPEEDPSSMFEALEPPEASEERERLAGWLGDGEPQEDFAFSSGDPLEIPELKLASASSAWRRFEASFNSEFILIRWEEVIAGDWLWAKLVKRGKMMELRR